MAVGPNNDFVVVWESYGSDGGAFETTSIRGQRFASDGTAQGGEFQVNTYTLGVAVNEYLVSHRRHERQRRLSGGLGQHRLG